MVIVGIDPSLTNTAVVFIEWTGERYVYCKGQEVRRSRKWSPARALSEIHDLVTYATAADFDACAIEDSAYGSFRLRGVAMALGAVLSALGAYSIEPALVAPSTVKKLVAGHGRASKEELAAAVREKCDGVPDDASHDLTDAIAIAMCVEVPK